MRLTVKETQEKLFELLLFLDDVCRKNDIPYWLDGGSLLGAVRHKGFIPWDDDIDVNILQTDYSRFIEVMQREVKKTKSFFLYNSYRPYRYFTDYLANAAVVKQSYLPIKIDIIRVKSIPDNEKSDQKDKAMVNLLKHFMGKKFDKKILPEDEGISYYNNKKINRRKLFYNYFIDNYLDQLKPDEGAVKYNYIYNDAMVNRTRSYYSKDDIFPLGEIEFEGKMFPCPNNLNNYLTILYGENYLLPPDKSKQIPSSDKNIQHRLPRPILGFWIYIVYLLKEIKYWVNYRKHAK